MSGEDDCSGADGYSRAEVGKVGDDSAGSDLAAGSDGDVTTAQRLLASSGPHILAGVGQKLLLSAAAAGSPACVALLLDNGVGE